MLVTQEMSSPATTELRVTGMTCNNCARHVTEAIQSVPHVRSAMVSLQSKRATIQWDGEGTKNVFSVVEAVAKAGYGATETTDEASRAGSPENRWQWTLIVGLAVTVLLLIGEWVLNLGMQPWFQWLSFALAAVVQVYCGAAFYSGAWRQLKVGQSNMDTLVALGSTTAFGYSAWALLAGAGGHLYFMEAAAIISLISFGHWIEARVSERASGALKSLMNLTPATARKLTIPQASEPRGSVSLSALNLRAPGADSGSAPMVSNGGGGFNLKAFSFSRPAACVQPMSGPKTVSEVDVPVADLELNDRVVLRPGDHVPVDGVVLEGVSTVNEAMLTGESIPVDKQSGSELFAGTVNLNGRLVMRVTATGEETALARIAAAVRRAQTSRAEIQRLGDRVSNVFVPVIVTTALAAGFWWGLAPASAGRAHAALARFLWPMQAPVGAAAGFIIAAAVLIIACPCAMGLATPAAIMAAANAAARRGILIRDGVALEKAGEITIVAFDKTGTLTVGKPVVAESWLAKEEVSVLSLAEGLTRNSTHPISRAILAHGEQNRKAGAAASEMTDWRELVGCGVAAAVTVAGGQPTTARLGSLRWLREAGVNLEAGGAFASEWSGQGATVAGLAVGTRLLALFAVRDALKPGAAQAVAELQRRGLRTYLLTGDNAQTAAAMAIQAGIAPENVLAEARPERKAEFIKQLQVGGARVAFVGDGINDAPALTQADLGIAVSRASDVAREAAEIILLQSDIEMVPEALGLARATLRVIKQNLFWAFFYNALGVPLAALGFISPIFCAAAMGVSDLVVIGNALRLLRRRRE
jgi:Cu+-exporting ATPase